MSIVEKVKDIAINKTDNTEYSLYDVEYVKEGSEYFLRIYFDKNGGINLDDCVTLSELMAEELDKEDFISDKYYLEVSSPGVERELRTLEEIKSSIDKYVYVKTYEKIDGIKEFYGYLTKVDGEIIEIDYKEKTRNKTVSIDHKKISKIRLAIKF